MTRSALIAVLALIAAPALAGPVSFSDWKEQRFSLFSSNDYGFGGSSLSIGSEGSVSLAFARLPETSWSATRAMWEWEVSKSVPATDLAKKGGDDRNASLYFVFLPEAEARALGPRAKVTAALQSDAARVLVYTWGDQRKRGTLLSSPYLGARGKTILLRPAGVGQFSESVDLAADHARAFGGSPGALVGLAVSADSDDTATSIKARISRLSLN